MPKLIKLPVGMSLWLAGAGLLANDSEVESRFRAEYPAAVGRLKSSPSNTVWKIRWNLKKYEIVEGDTQTVSPKFEREYQKVCYIKGSYPTWSCLELVEIVADTPQFEAWCDTQNYEFWLQRSGGHPWWVLKFLNRERTTGASRLGGTPAGISFMDEGFAIDEMLNNPNFIISKASVAFQDDAELVQLHYARTEPTNTAVELQRRMVLSPGLSWALKETEVVFRYDNGGTTRRTIKVDYQERADNLVLPKLVRLERHTYDPSGKEIGFGIGETDYTDVSFETVADEKFTLASFGLVFPDPSPPKMGNSTLNMYDYTRDWLAWAVLPVAVLGGISVLFVLRMLKRWYTNRTIPQ